VSRRIHDAIDVRGSADIEFDVLACRWIVLLGAKFLDLFVIKGLRRRNRREELGPQSVVEASAQCRVWRQQASSKVVSVVGEACWGDTDVRRVPPWNKSRRSGTWHDAVPEGRQRCNRDAQLRWIPRMRRIVHT
jgi:hypothetical protein